MLTATRPSNIWGLEKLIFFNSDQDLVDTGGFTKYCAMRMK